MQLIQNSLGRNSHVLVCFLVEELGVYVSSCFESWALGELSKVGGSHWGAPSSWRSGSSVQAAPVFLGHWYVSCVTGDPACGLAFAKHVLCY